MRYLLIIAVVLVFSGCKTHSPELRSAISVQKSFTEALRTQSASTVWTERFVVEARVVIARDGRVVSSVVTQSSGNQQADELVTQVLKSVTHVPPFPVGVQDDKKTFVLSFALKPKI
jgi:TonB family protein